MAARKLAPSAPAVTAKKVTKKYFETLHMKVYREMNEGDPAHVYFGVPKDIDRWRIEEGQLEVVYDEPSDGEERKPRMFQNEMIVRQSKAVYDGIREENASLSAERAQIVPANDDDKPEVKALRPNRITGPATAMADIAEGVSTVGHFVPRDKRKK